MIYILLFVLETRVEIDQKKREMVEAIQTVFRRQ